MRRVLLISSFFPPSVKVGAVRAGGLAKHLPRFGWEVVALTPQLPGRKGNRQQIIETGHRDILADFKARLGCVQKVRPARQLDFAGQQTARTTGQQKPNPVVKWLRAAIIYPDEYKGWIPFGVSALEKFAKRETVDAILSTSPANSGHIIASHAKTIWQCPWIADLRDLWSDAGTAPPGMGFFQRRLEKRTLLSADILVTVSDPWVQLLQQTFPHKPVTKIVNGFDPDDLPSGAQKLTSNFSITYTGYLYPGQSDPTPVFEALRQLIAENRISRTDVSLRFFGTSDGLVALAKRFGIEDILQVHGWVSREESLVRQRESQILLLFGKTIPSYSGCYPAKLFEYLASQRPILAVGGPRGVTAQLLTETGTGMQASSSEDICNFLANAYDEFRRSRQVQYQGISNLVNGYTQSAMVQKFAELLDSLVPVH